MYVIRTLNSVYLSLFLDMPPPPIPKMSFGQQNVITYVHNSVSGILGLGGNRVVEVKEDNIQLKTLTSGGQLRCALFSSTE